jgi:hypothetical protein
LAILVVLGLCVAVVGVMYRVSKTGEVDPHLNPLNMIFANRAIVGAVRITLLFVAAYIVVSCIGLLWQRRWLISFWPLKAADPVAKSVGVLDEERAAYEAALADAYQTIETLQESNQAYSAEITEMGDAYEEASICPGCRLPLTRVVVGTARLPSASTPPSEALGKLLSVSHSESSRL